MDELHQYAEPSYAEHVSSLSVVLPHGDIRGLRNVLERMKAFSEYVLLTARDVAVGAGAGGGGGGERTAMLQLQVSNRPCGSNDLFPHPPRSRATPRPQPLFTQRRR